MTKENTFPPTYVGYCSTARDALKLFEASIQGRLHHIPRRPHDRERAEIIKSGSIFIYEENASGIKRWTDGVPWSPSRILGNFLIYRELTRPFPPGEKKRAQKRPKSNRAARAAADPYPSQRRSSGETAGTDGSEKDAVRAFVGSLTDSYDFKPDGLIKKTMSVNYNGTHHHMVSYYTLEDVMSQKLHTPTTDKDLEDIEPRKELLTQQNFRSSLDESQIGIDTTELERQGYAGYGTTYSARPPQTMGYMPAINPMVSQSQGMYSNGPYPATIPAPMAYTTAPTPQPYHTATTMSQPYGYAAATAHGSLPLVDTNSTPRAQHPYHHHHRDSFPSNTSHISSRVGSMESMTPTSDGRASDAEWRGHGHNGSYSASPQSAYGSGPGAATWGTAMPQQPREESWSNGYDGRSGEANRSAGGHAHHASRDFFPGQI